MRQQSREQFAVERIEDKERHDNRHQRSDFQPAQNYEHEDDGNSNDPHQRRIERCISGERTGNLYNISRKKQTECRAEQIKNLKNFSVLFPFMGDKCAQKNDGNNQSEVYCFLANSKQISEESCVQLKDDKNSTKQKFNFFYHFDHGHPAFLFSV